MFNFFYVVRKYQMSEWNLMFINNLWPKKYWFVVIQNKEFTRSDKICYHMKKSKGRGAPTVVFKCELKGTNTELVFEGSRQVHQL